MPQSDAPDHDQRLKVLIKEFFHAFFLCFFPDWAARFEFVDIDWLDNELFLAPPQGERRQLDLVARLKLRPGGPPPRAGATDLVALVHLELESRASALAFRPRMFCWPNAWRPTRSWTSRKMSGCKRCSTPRRIARSNPS